MSFPETKVGDNQTANIVFISEQLKSNINTALIRPQFLINSIRRFWAWWLHADMFLITLA